MNVKTLVLGATVLTLGATSPIAERLPHVSFAATVAQEREPALDVRAVCGSLSDFWGEAMELTESLWLMENADATSIVLASEDTLTVYFLDKRPETVARLVRGSPRAFMDLVTQACGDCSDQACCNTSCTVDTCPWCLCSARVNCAPHGISSYSCVAQPFSCSFSCNPPT